MCKACLGYYRNMVRIGAYAAVGVLAVMAVAAGARAADSAAQKALPSCFAYDKFNNRGGEVPIPSNCDSLSPELGGLRSKLTENGFNLQIIQSGTLVYDVLDHGGPVQLYSGQDPSSMHVGMWIGTYDLSRLGLPENSQITTSVFTYGASFDLDAINGARAAQISAYIPLMDGQITTQFGYYGFGGAFYGTIIGANIAQSTLGAQSSFMAQMGAQGFNPTPSFDVRILSDDRKFYNHFGISRSVSPKGVFTEADINPSGLRFTVPGAEVVMIDEIGYRTEGPGERKKWVRAGVAYNTSDYARLDNPQETEHNLGFYAAATLQLTQPNPELYFQGWYLDVRGEISRENVNAISSTAGVNLYKIGTFDSRPFDLFGVGINRSNFSDTLRGTLARFGAQSEAYSTSYSLNYTAQIRPGLYLQTGLSYVDNPTFTPKLDNALNARIGVTAVF